MINLMRSLALAMWMAGLYGSIFYPEWGALAGRGWLWDPPALAGSVDPARVLIEMTLWNLSWLLLAWAFSLGIEVCTAPSPKISNKIRP